MHSRIFQVDIKPIDECDYIEESNYWDHWFLNEVADYVVDSRDRNYDIDWLKSCYESKGIEFGADKNGKYFIVKNKRNYFADKFEAYTEVLDKLQHYTLDDFINGIHDMWSLKNYYEEKFGFYVDVDGELLSFDGFIRYCTTDIKYYIGGTIDYHC